MRAAVQEAKANLQGWYTNLSQLRIERKAGDAALMEMKQNVAARLEVKMQKSSFPLIFTLLCVLTSLQATYPNPSTAR